MSTVSTANNPDFETPTLPAFVHTSASLDYAVTHVFLPVQVPNDDDNSLENDSSLVRAVCVAAHAYSVHLYGTSDQVSWDRITKMLDNLQACIQSEDSTHIISQLRGMQTGDILAFFTRRPSQTFAVTLTKRENATLCESFEVSPSGDAVERMSGPVICSYPSFAVEIPNEVFDDGDFHSKFANFLSCSTTTDSANETNLPPPPLADSQCIVALLSGILGGIDGTSSVPRITKRIREHVWLHWRRSSLWLFVRVAIQVSLNRTPLGLASYKRFILFFLCTLAKEGNDANLSSDLLHLMSCKVLRRLAKLVTSTPNWLSEMALRTCACLRETLDARLKQLNPQRTPFQNPSEDELARDTQLSLLNSHDYIRDVLANPNPVPFIIPFYPVHLRRGTIEDFLSSNGTFFEEACRDGTTTTLYDVEQSVEQGIDDWIACVVNVDEACTQLGTLMHQYIIKGGIGVNPEAISIRYLTAVELFIALDKLAVKEIPILADYSPEIPIAHLEKLLLRKTTSLHRLSCAYQYLSWRHSRSRPGWSVLSDEFTEDSFPVRYYDQSLDLQHLQARVEGDVGLQQASHSPLPLSLVHTKAIVFELQSPACLRIWRSAIAQILTNFCTHEHAMYDYAPRLLADAPGLQPYVKRKEPNRSAEFCLAYSEQVPWQSQSGPTLRYVLGNYGKWILWHGIGFSLPEHRYNDLAGMEYVTYTSHTSNDILAAQAHCPDDLSLDEFITFGHLRSGGSLQWLNILHGLRSRTLNLRRTQVHYLLAQAAFQVGPLDLNTGTWKWHQELLDASFCNALLDELESLFMDVGTGVIDGVLMNTISLLLTRVLASTPGEAVTERAIGILRLVRRETFKWVEELSYNVILAPESKERIHLLVDMATTCRSTFDVDTAILRKVCHAAEDVDALLSCAFFQYILEPSLSLYDDSEKNSYSKLLIVRDCRLSFQVEGILRDVILTDPSDHGVDLAVARVFLTYQPGPQRLEQLQSPNNRWLTCESKATADQPSQTIHLNLLNGQLEVDGEPLGGLLLEYIDRDRFHVPKNISVVQSNFPKMDFRARVVMMTSKYKVRLLLRDDSLVVQAHCNRTGDILELIPLEKLQGDLPPDLVNRHIHWLYLSRKTIEIRPDGQPWEESSENWSIDCTSGQYRAYKGREVLVDIRSPTWAIISRCFEPLNNVGATVFGIRLENSSSQLLITLSSVDSPGCPPARRLLIALTLYRLSFFVNERKELESCDFKNMVYDEDQRVGALFGLENVLVLRHTTHIAGASVPEALIPRRILIPNGLPEKYHEDHRVQIDIYSSSTSSNSPRLRRPVWLPDYLSPAADWVLYHTYDVDTELGCLVGNGSFASTQYLAVLHAITNCYGPDPLTGKTGAQASLDILQSVRCRSIMKLDDLNDNVYFRGIHDEFPQIYAAYEEIRGRYYGTPAYNRKRYATHAQLRAAYVRDRYAAHAQRAAYLFPCWNHTSLRSTEDSGHSTESSNRSTTHGPVELATPFALPRGLAFESPVQCRRDDEHGRWPITLEHLLSSRPPPELPSRSTLLPGTHTGSSEDNLSDLSPLFTFLPMNKSGPSFQKRYIALLENSARHARDGSQMIHKLTGQDQIRTLGEHYAQCRTNYFTALGTLKKSLGPTTDPLEQALEQFGQWPPITGDYLLRRLASTSQTKVPPSWKKCLISLALLLLDLQRARRLLRFALDGLEEEFSNEFENEVCDGWDAEDHPDWLLIQVQGNLLIRRAQAEIAMEIISPKSGTNTVMQVNMGEGKSSVIIPITAAVLADGKQLVRVIVPKALTVQMFELLVNRLGGLTNRPIYHLPFSRSRSRSHSYSNGFHVDDIHELMSRCMAEHGVLLVQPEQVMSLKLMSVEQQIPEGKLAGGSLLQHQKAIYKLMMTAVSLTSVPQDSLVGHIYKWLRQFPNRLSQINITRAGHRDNISEAKSTLSDKPKWLRLQKWIHSNARDILDESDEILHSRFQLVYTMGLQQHMDGYPNRWAITQQVLWLVKEHIHTLSKNHPNSVEYATDSPPGSFPGIRIVRASDVGQRIIPLVIEDVMAGRLPGFNFQHLSSELQGAIHSFISDPDVFQIPDTAKRVEEYAKGNHQNHLWNGLLLLRGLLACNILLFALVERRWRVDYGLDLRKAPTPTLLAVPYRAKDMPAPDTQFGHPDITIILTCLSYYYTGLTKEQLKVSFQLLLDDDNPSTEYTHWVKEFDHDSLSDSLLNFREISLDSSEQWDKATFPLFSRNQATIDFYLSRVVFPKEAKEFPRKISASSWDLAETREKFITGFSGTNDSRWLLPMSIAQRDLDQQKGTSAKVLARLLRPENDSYMVINESGERWSTFEFFRVLTAQQPEIRILLDVGAQILDFSNREVAQEWLNIFRDADGAIYFNENDELMLLERNGADLPMVLSPLSRRLDRCVVYLDHVHTRGTDLKLPIGSRAAVTLGPKLTKDSLVQSCMRMRKLGHGHSVMFFAPLEVDRSIRAVITNKDRNARITTVDIICWAIHETWIDIQQRAPYWAQQGMDHQSRHQAWNRFCSGELTPEKLADAWLQPDTKSLANLYAPCEINNASSSLSNLDSGIRQRCKTLGVLSLPDAQMEEEQEREVNREREREREVELPPEAKPAKHALHPDVIKFVTTGDIDLVLHVHSAFRPIFTTLGRTTAAAVTSEADVWSPFILATVDFCQTIEPESTEGTMDQYLRPVQWILTRSRADGRDQVLVLLSPFEADALMPDIRASKHVHLHVYSPRALRRMRPCDDLKLYTIPPLSSDWTPPWDLIDQLNIFAGQLYIRDYTSYLRLCHFLDIPRASSNGTSIRLNLFDIPGSLEETEIRFSGSPLPSVMALLAMRSRGRPFADSHMGNILQGQMLIEKDFGVTMMYM